MGTQETLPAKLGLSGYSGNHASRLFNLIPQKAHRKRGLKHEYFTSHYPMAKNPSAPLSELQAGLASGRNLIVTCGNFPSRCNASDLHHFCIFQKASRKGHSDLHESLIQPITTSQLSVCSDAVCWSTISHPPTSQP